MRTVIVGELPPEMTSLLERRQRLGLDRFDEVWAGEYHMNPGPHSWHGDLDAQLAEILGPRARAHGFWPFDQVNIGDPDDYRVPDRVILRERAGAVWHQTAALVVEVVSPNDESYAKFDFYHRRLVDEVLIVDPARRSVELFARGDDAYVPADRSGLIDLAVDELSALIDWPG